jgi:hypothetical protein
MPWLGVSAAIVMRRRQRLSGVDKGKQVFISFSPPFTSTEGGRKMMVVVAKNEEPCVMSEREFTC